MTGRFLAALLLATLHPGVVRAEPLTCNAFETRLFQTIRDLGGLVGQPSNFKVTYDGGETGSRFEWSGIAGLSGTVNCGKTGSFEDFSIAIDDAARTSDALPIVLDRFVELASASVCTLADGTPEACRALVRKMTIGSLAQFKDAEGKGDTMPAGTRDFFIVDGVDAELSMTPVGITWSVGPGLAMSTPAGKQPLRPRNLDR